MDSAGSLTPAFHLQVFFAFGKVPSGRCLLQTSPFSRRPKSGQIRSKLPCPATTPPAPQNATQGGKQGGSGGGLAPVDAASQILCFFNSFHPLS